MEVCLGLNKNISKHIVTIEGKSIDCYPNADDLTLTDYSYNNCISANIIETVDCSENTTRIPNEDGSICDPYNIIIHAMYDDEKNATIYNPDVCNYYFKNDGWYRFTHYIIPTKEYFVNLGFNGLVNVDELKLQLLERFGDCELPERIVVFDTEKFCFLLGELFKYKILTYDDDNNPLYTFETHYEWKQISFEEVICISKSNFTSTILCYSLNIINYSYLEEKYLSKILDLLKIYLSLICTSNCNDFAKSNLSDIQLRDYYWMALNAVKYANELGNYCKALQLLNCVSLCSSNNNSDTYCLQVNYENGCGCS